MRRGLGCLVRDLAQRAGAYSAGTRAGNNSRSTPVAACTCMAPLPWTAQASRRRANLAAGGPVPTAPRAPEPPGAQAGQREPMGSGSATPGIFSGRHLCESALQCCHLSLQIVHLCLPPAERSSPRGLGGALLSGRWLACLAASALRCCRSSFTWAQTSKSWSICTSRYQGGREDGGRWGASRVGAAAWHGRLSAGECTDLVEHCRHFTADSDRIEGGLTGRTRIQAGNSQGPPMGQGNKGGGLGGAGGSAWHAEGGQILRAGLAPPPECRPRAW